jgi:phage shock protein PspC (stress-responsive transcriptional regulator)
MSTPKDSRAGVAAIAGLVLIVVGVWALLVATGVVSTAMLDLLGRSVGALAIIGLGVAVLVFSRRKTPFTMPAQGTRLYRSRTDKMIGGVLGGLGAYFGIDPVILRIATVLLTLVGLGSLVIAYIVMWIVVPEEPLKPYVATAPSTQPEPTGWPAPTPPPAPPAPPAPAEPPAPVEPPAPSADGS